MQLANRFNETAFSRWINGGSGRVFRLCGGITFLIVGIVYHDDPLGIAALVWSFFPLIAGIFNVCWISLVLGGPFKSSTICRQQHA